MELAEVMELNLLIRKKAGRLSGWIAYTLSRTEEQFSQINNGNWFPATQDRTHDISIVMMYNYNSDWNFSATWSTIQATQLHSRVEITGLMADCLYYTERNGYRMPPYHRLDFSATWILGSHSNLNFSLYNAYDRWNAYTITFQQVPNDPSKTEAMQTTFFPIIPSYGQFYILRKTRIKAIVKIKNEIWIPMLFALISVAFNSCQKVISVDLNNANPHIVIEGVVTDKPGPYTVSLSMTGNYFTPSLYFPPVTGAKIVIQDDKGQRDSLKETAPGTYLFKFNGN